MIVEINLLEEKEKKNITPHFISLLTLLFIVGVGAILYLQKQELMDTKQALASQTTQLQAQQAQIQQVLNDKQLKQRKQLASMVDLVENSLFPTISITEDMIALLPEHGYIEQYGFTNEKLNLQVRLDTFQDISAFLNHLQEKPYINEVNLTNISTEPMSQDSSKYNIRPRYHASYQVTFLQKSTIEEDK